MQANAEQAQTRLDRAEAGGWLERLARRAAFKALGNLQRGSLELIEGDRRMRFGARGEHGELHAEMRIHDAGFYRALALGGTIGAAEAYIDGQWTSPDLTRVVRVLARDLDAAKRMEQGWARLAEPLRRLYAFATRNTRAGSRRNIAAHYDLGNDFFRLFLDETWAYSSGIYDEPGASLHEASRAKFERACAKLELEPEDHLLEIGTGWGGLAMHAAREYGCRVTTVTISREQYEHARRAIAEAGLGEKIDVQLCDYRDLHGRYDKLVSIEMIEAVGREYLGDFMAKCSSLLRPEGMMLLQTITIPDQEFERAAREVDFIKRYVFPGGCLPSVCAIIEALRDATDMRLTHMEDFGTHYARTLESWRERLLERAGTGGALDRARYDERFMRLWDFYFCYCEAAFLERRIGVAQMLFAKPDCRRDPLLGRLAATDLDAETRATAR